MYHGEAIADSWNNREGMTEEGRVGDVHVVSFLHHMHRNLPLLRWRRDDLVEYFPGWMNSRYPNHGQVQA